MRGIDTPLAREDSEDREALIWSTDISASSGTQIKSCPVECLQSSGLRVRCRGVSVVAVVLMWALSLKPICPVFTLPFEKAFKGEGTESERPLVPTCVDRRETPFCFGVICRI